MPRRQHPRSLPVIWYFTDSRSGAAIWSALDRLPRGSGIVFRHHDLERSARAALLRRVAAVARRRRLLLIVAGAAYGIRADGIHVGSGQGARARGLVTASAHDEREMVRAWRAGAALVFVSPVFATNSHPGARVLGPVGFGRVARGAGIAVAALGGMTPARFRGLQAWGASGWGAIDAWDRPGPFRQPRS